MGKISLKGVAMAYIGTLRSYRTGKIMKRDIAVQIVLPAALGFAVAFIWDGDGAGFSGNVVSGVSIFSGLLCGVAALVFQLRTQMAFQDDPKPTKRELKLIDDTFHDILWAVVAGFAAVSFMLAGDVLAEYMVWRRLMTALAVAFLSNFVLVTCMCIKRLGSAYTVVSKGWSKE